MQTMTLWGAYAKVEAIARAAELLGLPGRTEIRNHVEGILCQPDMPAHALSAALADWRGRLGAFHGRTANWLDEALLALLDYLDLPEVHLTGAELLDHLMAGTAQDDPDVTAAANLYTLTSVS